MTIDAQVLEELKNKLIQEKEKLETELKQFASPTDKEGDFKTNFPDDLGNRDDENATEVEEYADRLAIEKTLETKLSDVLKALNKIEAGTYGIDENTGEEISIERLRVYPAATTNVVKNDN
jgi:RNA polymerase-binding transcription factor DksA